MFKLAHIKLTALLALPAIIGMSACGGTSQRPATLARIGPTVITTAEVSHWMAALGGEDFYEVSHGRTAPEGLVSDPPNYARCLSSLQVVAGRATVAGPRPTAASLLRKCQQLHEAVKQQALMFLVNYYFVTSVDKEWGIQASEAEAAKGWNGLRHEARYQPEGGIERVLAARRWSVADELLLMKLNVLRDKAKEALTRGGAQAERELRAIISRWTAKTICEPGYLVEHCAQYKPSMPNYPNTPPPAVLMEQVAVLTGLPCGNREGCG
jgi:predicted nucleic acid-binding Zn ribbon protein